MSASFTDNPEKQLVRASWDTPLLRYLHSEYGIRYRYMGLPGVDLIDLRLWRGMIDEVVAFEPPDDTGTRRANIEKLRRNLKVFGFNGRAYYGSFEEVVLLGKDFDGLEYSQTRVVTLYNLDFCDEIASPVATRDGRKQLRFAALRQVFRDQAQSFRDGEPKYFVFLLTVRNQIEASKIKKFLTGNLLAHAKDFYDACIRLLPIPPSGRLIGTHGWALKTFLFDLLSQNFKNPNFSAIFLPVVLYKGTKIRTDSGLIDSPMIHMALICRFDPPESQGPEILPKQFLPMSSVKVSQNRLVWQPQIGEARNRSGSPDAAQWVRDYGSDFLKGLFGH